MVSSTERDEPARDDSAREDDALSWEGDDDPAFVTGRAVAAPARSTREPEKAPAVAPAPVSPAGSTHWALQDAPTPERPAGLSNAGLVAIGVLGGIYALLTVGWIVGGLRLQSYALFFVAPVAFQVSLWLAVITPAAWFGTVLALTRSGRGWVRFLLLVAGAILLLPWPFIMVGAVGA